MRKWIALLLAVCLLGALLPVASAAKSEAAEAAETLYGLGLFQGTGTDAAGRPNFDLERAPTRAEAVTMLVRLLGKEDAARAGAWQTPFTDVADWAKPYVGYAYANGLTDGVDPTHFGGGRTVTAAQYLTFVLRALGYESGTDFQWNAAWELTDALGISEGRYGAAAKPFTRGDAAIVSAAALRTEQKGNGTTLLNAIAGSVDQTALRAWQAREAEQTAWEQRARNIRIADYHLPSALGTQTLSFDRALALRHQPPETVAQEVKSLADLLQYMIAVRFGYTTDAAYTPWYEGWGFDAPGDEQLRRNKACCCGGFANFASYLLRGDYEKVGILRWIGDNHEINWVYADGAYYVFDLTAYCFAGNYRSTDVPVCRYQRLEAFCEDRPEAYRTDTMRIVVAFETQAASFPWGYESDGTNETLIFPTETQGRVQVLHVDAGCTVEYRPLTAARSSVFDGSGLSVGRYQPKQDGLILIWGADELPGGWGFGRVSDGDTTVVYWNRQLLRDFTVTVEDPAMCTVAKGADGVLTFTNVRGDTKITITGPAGTADYMLYAAAGN